MGCRGYPFACGGGSMAMAPHSSETVIARAPTIMAALFWRFWPERDVGGFCCPADETLKIATTKKIHSLVWGAVRISVLSGNGPTRHSIRHNLSTVSVCGFTNQIPAAFARAPREQAQKHKMELLLAQSRHGNGNVKGCRPCPNSVLTGIRRKGARRAGPLTSCSPEGKTEHSSRAPRPGWCNGLDEVAGSILVRAGKAVAVIVRSREPEASSQFRRSQGRNTVVAINVLRPIAFQFRYAGVLRNHHCAGIIQDWIAGRQPVGGGVVGNLR